MVQIGLFSTAVFTFLAISFSLFLQHQVWKALLISSIVTLGVFMPNTLVFILLVSGIIYFLSLKPQLPYFRIKLAISILLGLLVLIKLKDFWIEHLNLSWSIYDNKLKNWIEIVGISFLVFNSISYLVDIKRGYILPEISYWRLLLYLLYFPTLFSGPLHRYTYLNDQFNQAKLTEESFTNGLRLILWGLFKNFVLAQRLNQLLIFLKGSEIGGWWTLLIGFVFFFYIYFSFSSFVDFFQGVSEIFNIRLKDNFQKRVYFSSNRHEFWKGWHITLNEWFRDYFFYWQIKFAFWRDKPYVLLLLTYLFIGLWHGLSWSYFLWGFLSGIWILTEKLLNIQRLGNQHGIRRMGGVIYHISLCSVLALVFIFPTLADLIHKIQLPSIFPHDLWLFQRRNICVILSMFLLIEFCHLHAKDDRIDEFLGKLSPWKRRLIYFQLLVFLFILGDFTGGFSNYYLLF